MRETELASKIMTELRHKHKCFVINIAGGRYQMVGLPDCLIIKDGIHIFVEFKGPRTPISAVQSKVKELLKTNGAFVLTVQLFEHNWIIDDLFSVKFRIFREGVESLLSTIMSLHSSSKNGKGGIQQCVSEIPETIANNY